MVNKTGKKLFFIFAPPISVKQCDESAFDVSTAGGILISCGLARAVRNVHFSSVNFVWSGVFDAFFRQ